MMRIIAGKARGKKLLTLPGEDTRPTLERVKQSLFSALQFELEDRKVLDLFAGSGQLGLEALSRGASYCWFNDLNSKAVEVVKKNISACGFEKNAKVSCMDGITCVKMVERAGFRPNLVFLDPPYRGELLQKVLLLLPSLLEEGAIVVAETDSEEQFSYEGLALRKEYRYGPIKLTVMEKRG